MTVAKERYGVIFNGQSLAVDYEATAALRREEEQAATLPKINVA